VRESARRVRRASESSRETREQGGEQSHLSVIGRTVDVRGEALVLASGEVVALEDGLLPEHGAAPAADDLLPRGLHLARLHPDQPSSGKAARSVRV
jgi:hypothetical protein